VTLDADREGLQAAQCETVERSGNGADGILQECEPFAHRPQPGSSAMTATPPMTSEWPFRYFVAECTTISMPSSSGRWLYGLANVLSAAVRMPCERAMLAIGAKVRELQQRISRRLDPDELRLWRQRGPQLFRVHEVDVGEE
jgi:hypothetical protein